MTTASTSTRRWTSVELHTADIPAVALALLDAYEEACERARLLREEGLPYLAELAEGDAQALARAYMALPGSVQEDLHAHNREEVAA